MEVNTALVFVFDDKTEKIAVRTVSGIDFSL